MPGSKAKQPWFIVLQSPEPMVFAGLWEVWRSPEGAAVESCSIIVTDANQLMAPIHERMPVILAPGDWDAWLGTDAKGSGGLQGMLRPYPAEGMVAWVVSTKVNNLRYDEPECIKLHE